MLTSCSDEVADAPSPFLNGTEKTPIIVESNISAQTPVTRAVDGSWETNDVFVAYIKHVTTTGTAPALTYAGEVTGTGVGPRLAGFNVSALTTGYTGTADNFNDHSATSTLVSTDANGLYWDDFSNSDEAAHDLRTENHALMSYYAYCYNGSPAYGQTGSSITTDLNQADGTLGWTVAADQTSGFKTSDLLWSGTQTPVKYAHVDAEGNRNHGTLGIPFTHAMSKVTIEIELGEGFDTYQSGDKNYARAFGTSIETSGRIATTPTLFANRETVVTAPTQTLSTTVAGNEDAGIQMYLSDDENTNPKHRVYEAIIAPTVMKAGNKLAEITVDGNKYDIVLTNDMLTTIPQGASGTAWNTQLKAYIVSSSTLTKNSTGEYDATNGGITLPGVNYRIKITLSKQRINVEAYITDWTNVTATGSGTIMFSADVRANVFTDATTAITSGSFNLWRSATNENEASYDADGDNSDDVIKEASTYTYNTTNSQWKGSPTIYWANGSQSYYFRALATYDGTTYAAFSGENKTHGATSDLNVFQGTDLVWAQTSEHKAEDAVGNYIQENDAAKVYHAGDPINPRTGNVPLTFQHAMSKITVKLETSESSAADHVVLDGAKISIENIYDKGTISIKEGSIGSLDLSTSAPTMPIENFGAFGSSETNKLDNYVVIPQSLVKMANGTTDRVVAKYYNASELTTIYSGKNSALNERYGSEAGNVSANTSIGDPTSAATSYLTSELEFVEKVLFTSDDQSLMDAHNNAIVGCVTTSNVKTPGTPYSYETYKSLSPMPHTTDAFTQQMYNDILSSSAKDAFIKEGDTYYTLEEFKALDAALFTEAMFNALPYTIKCSPDVLYTEAEAKAYNQELGCWYIGDVKIPAHYKLPATPPTPHNAGDVKTVGTAIMMYIKLADNTTYKLELPTCIAEDSADPENPTYIKEWEPGKHYTYKIKIVKEAISFIAMIKEWEEKSASGNATLDWD